VRDRHPSVSSPAGGGGPRRGGGGRRPGADLAKRAPIPGFAGTSPGGGRDAHVSSGTRNAGYVACLIGTLVMISGRFMQGAPVWLVYVGLAGVVFGWGLLGLSVVRAAARARARRETDSTISKG
jgi:hypothetical protein